MYSTGPVPALRRASLLLLLLVLLVLLLSACAQWPGPREAPVAARGSEALAFWASAVESDEGRRKSLLAGAQAARASWKITMLQSLPGSEGHDPAAAEKSLQALLRQNLAKDERALTRLRLAELRALNACTREQGELRERLGRIADIERQIDGGH